MDPVTASTPDSPSPAAGAVAVLLPPLGAAVVQFPDADAAVAFPPAAEVAIDELLALLAVSSPSPLAEPAPL